MEERGQTQQGNDSSRFKYSGDDARAHRGDEVIGVRACDERYDAHNADAVNSSDDGGGADGVSLPLSLQRGDAVHHDNALGLSQSTFHVSKQNGIPWVLGKFGVR